MARVGSALVCAAALVQSAGAFTTPSISRRGPVSYRSSLRSSVVTATKESLVTPITSMEQFLAEKKKADEVGSPIMVVKFYASWCRACKSIAPRFKKVAMEYNDNIACYEIEFVANQELCKELGIKKLPCMHFCTLSLRARARARSLARRGTLDSRRVPRARFPQMRASSGRSKTSCAVRPSSHKSTSSSRRISSATLDLRSRASSPTCSTRTTSPCRSSPMRITTNPFRSDARRARARKCTRERAFSLCGEGYAAVARPRPSRADCGTERAARHTPRVPVRSCGQEALRLSGSLSTGSVNQKRCPEGS